MSVWHVAGICVYIFKNYQFGKNIKTFTGQSVE